MPKPTHFRLRRGRERSSQGANDPLGSSPSGDGLTPEEVCLPLDVVGWLRSWQVDPHFVGHSRRLSITRRCEPMVTLGSSGTRTLPGRPRTTAATQSPYLSGLP